MDIVRINTAGSVDDGKSTLIGRLLYDTKSVPKDKLEAIELSSKRKGLNFTDLSLLTDGLIAEREQGITIDVAHIYFSTKKRKYIIADTPGHVEYTRNMITGASTADATIVLIDARNGVVEQTRRHLFISALLKIETVFVCINKMDIVGFDAAVFYRIEKEIKQIAESIGFAGQLNFIPIAAKSGDNVVHVSEEMSWYSGKVLLDYLEELPVHKKDEELPARFPVQFVIRPHSDEHHDYRGYAGKLTSGILTVGQEVVVLPSMKTTRISKMHRHKKEIDFARAGESISIQLEQDIDISRGNMIALNEAPVFARNHFGATICWMHDEPLTEGKTFLLQHGVNIVKAKITGLKNKVDIQTLAPVNSVHDFKLNDIGQVQLKTGKPIFADVYNENPRNGAFILIDEFNNSTVAVGFIESFS